MKCWKNFGKFCLIFTLGPVFSIYQAGKYKNPETVIFDLFWSKEPFFKKSKLCSQHFFHSFSSRFEPIFILFGLVIWVEDIKKKMPINYRISHTFFNVRNPHGIDQKIIRVQPKNLDFPPFEICCSPTFPKWAHLPLDSKRLPR